MWITLSNGKRIKLWFKYTRTICYSKIEFIKNKRIEKIVNYETFTSCFIDDGIFIYSGEAVCSPKDKFVKSIGREIALERCLQKLDYPLGFIIEIRKAYTNR